LTMHSEQRLRDTIDAMAAIGCDELILVPASADPAMLDLITAVVDA